MTNDSNTSAPRETLRAGRRAQQFVRTPEWVVVSGISPQALGLYTVLLGHVNHSRDDTLVWPGMDALADLLRFKQRKSVQRYLRELVELGAIEVERERSMRRRNVYTVHETPPDGYTGHRTFKNFWDAREGRETAGHPPRGTAVPLRTGTSVPLATGTAALQNQTNTTRRSSTIASGAAPSRPAARRDSASGAAPTGSAARADRNSEERRQELPVERHWLTYANEILELDILDHVCEVNGGVEPPGVGALICSMVGAERPPMLILNTALKMAREGISA